MMKKLWNIMANRLFIVAVLILLQLGLIIGVMVSLSGFKLVSDLLRFINFFLIIYIVNKQENPSYKLAWIILVLGKCRRRCVGKRWRKRPEPIPSCRTMRKF